MTSDNPFDPPEPNDKDDTPCPECNGFNCVPNYDFNGEIRPIPASMPWICLSCRHEWGGE